MSPSTPPSTGISAQVYSTPQQPGSASHYASGTHHTCDDFHPYLTADLAQVVRISFADFLQYILGVSSTWLQDQLDYLNNLTQTQQYINLRNAYCARVTHEDQRYHPFSLLANHCLGSNPSITFCRNDGTYIKGSSAKRKPDVVGVWPSALEGERGGVDNLSKNGPGEENAFSWRELTTFIEHKRGKAVIGVSKPKKGKPNLRPTRSAPSLRTPKTVKAPPLPSDRVTRQAKAPQSSTSTRVDRSAPASLAGSTGAKRSFDGSSEQQPKRPKPDSDAPLKYEVQCASYALEMMSQGGLRSHVIGGLVTDGNIELLYYDRSIIIRSYPLTFIDKPQEFVATLQGMSRLTQPQWGFLDIIKPPSDPQLISKDSHSLFKNFTLQLDGGLELLLLDTVFHQHGLIGRGTCVVRALVECVGKLDDHWKGSIVTVKFSWPAATRLSECSIVEKARQYATVHNAAMLNHLPYILHHEDVKVKETALPSDWLAKTFPKKYERRILRIIIQEELFPLTELQKASEAATVFRDVFNCHRWLFEKVKILHRDISLNNLMYRKDRNGGLMSGVLNDYDLAILYTGGQDSPSSKHRTGTRPFMAIDLLRTKQPCEHLYRHDLESLFYVILLFTCRWENGKEKNGKLDEWFHLRGDDLASKKYDFVGQCTVPEPTKAFVSFKTWTEGMIRMFAMGQSAHLFQASDTFEKTTLGGYVTFGSFATILESTIIDQLER